jgi:hypothetical protein
MVTRWRGGSHARLLYDYYHDMVSSKKTYRHHSDTVPSLSINTTKLKHRANPEAPYFIKLYKLMGRYLTITVKISSHLEIDN